VILICRLLLNYIKLKMKRKENKLNRKQKRNIS
jgi:hypothetical protein